MERPRRIDPHKAATGLALLLLVVLAGDPTGAAAQTGTARNPYTRAWVPPFSDSLEVWAAEVRTQFKAQRGDSVTGGNFAPFEQVGSTARRLLLSMGRANTRQAPIVETFLDSLGLDTEVAIDLDQPGFVLLVVRNPYLRTSQAVGFFYWYRGGELRMQGMGLAGGIAPRMRVWYTGRSQQPYRWGLVDRRRGATPELGLYFLNLSADAGHLELVQYPGAGPDLGPGEAAWTDINRDGAPELAVWSPALPDSRFVACPECPRLYTERIYALRAAGYELHDSRILPSPFASLALFLRLLAEDRAAAARLLSDPAKVEQAVALGWATRRAGAWTFENAEQGEAWPRWMAFRFRRGTANETYVFHFTTKDGRWIIRDWARSEGRTARPGGSGR